MTKRQTLDLLERKLDIVLEYLQLIFEKVKSMSAELDRVKASVTALTTVITSAETLLGQLAELVRANATNPVELNKIADELDARKGELAAAVAANTPTAPPVP
mgnify:CR=1 FL=1